MECGDDLDVIIDLIAAKLSVEAIALGFEAQMYVPVRDAPMRLTNACSGEGSRAWSAGAGCGVLATSLPITAYVFGKLRQAVPDASASLDRRTFEPEPRRLLLFEAFVSGRGKGNTHAEDAALAVRHPR